MANEEHLRIIRAGVREWNQWREIYPEIQPDLKEANLCRANLKGANLRRANLMGTDLREANFEGADLSMSTLLWANLNEANLCGPILNFANLGEADLTGTKLINAYLIEASLIRSNLRWANLSKANLKMANLICANLTGATLNGTNLVAANLIGANLEKATLNGCFIFGISVWDVQLKDTIQENLIITESIEPTITIDNLEVAQFIYLLLHNEKVRQVIDTITTKVVLILGRFTPERKAVLDGIREELRRRNYIPILFDFDKPESKDTHETITTLARLARFVIADITEPKSIPQELVSIVETLPSLPIQPLLKEGDEPWGMYDHIKRYPWVLAIHRYRDLQDLLSSLKEKVIEPAEAKVTEIRGQK